MASTNAVAADPRPRHRSPGERRSFTPYSPRRRHTHGVGVQGGLDHLVAGCTGLQDIRPPPSLLSPPWGAARAASPKAVFPRPVPRRQDLLVEFEEATASAR